MSDSPMCVCGDRLDRHRGRRGGCKELDCTCGRFDPVDDAPAVEFVRPVGYASDIEQAERDELTGQPAPEQTGPASDWARLRADVQRAKAQAELAEAQRDGAAREAGRLREELDRANAERQRLAEELATEVQAHRATQLAVKSSTGAYLATTTAAAADVLGTYDAWQCLTCGSRYGQDDREHPCGRLVPVRVTIARRPAGAQPKEH